MLFVAYINVVSRRHSIEMPIGLSIESVTDLNDDKLEIAGLLRLSSPSPSLMSECNAYRKYALRNHHDMRDSYWNVGVREGRCDVELIKMIKF